MRSVSSFRYTKRPPESDLSCHCTENFASAHPAQIATHLIFRVFQICNFASAHPAQIATEAGLPTARSPCSLPQHIPRKLQQGSTTQFPCNDAALPQHIPRKLQLTSCGSSGPPPTSLPAQIATRSLDRPEDIDACFASAHPAQIATRNLESINTTYNLCLSTSRANCNGEKHKCFFI